MRDRILAFVQALRARGIDVSLAEVLDATAAVAAAGVEREVLREALAASLVKDEADRPTFDRLFEEMFPGSGGGSEEGRRRRRARGMGGGGVPGGAGQGGTATGRTQAPLRSPPGAGERRASETTSAQTGEHAEKPHADTSRPGRAARSRRLVHLPFREFTSIDVEEARPLVRELGLRFRGRLARRTRSARRGRLDFRRTFRAAMSTGGVPARPRWRARRPGRPDLLALCDLSGSVAAASELLLGLLAPATAYFRRVHLFAYVDRLCPVSIENGHVAPGGPLDLHARSDFGRVLADLWQRERDLLARSTLLLVLGDARNNRLPPRPDLLRAVRDRVQRVIWLVPEPQVRWDTGDSVLGLYADSCDAILECLDLGTLVRSVRRVL